MRDQNGFKETLMALGELFNKEITPALAKLYWGALNEFSDEDVGEAMNQAVIRFKFMPKPVELRELIQGSASDNATSRWGGVLELMRKDGRFGADRLSGDVKSAINELGGYEYLCTLSYKQLEFKGREFCKIYEGRQERGLISHTGNEKRELLR